MLNSINTGTSGLTAFSKELQTISNNVANLNTPGFKGAHSQFTALFSEGGQGSAGGSGIGTLPSVIDFAQGQINQTGNDLDVAIDGDGFFVSQDKTGQLLYSRDGQFKFNADGVLVNAAGDKVRGMSASGVMQDIKLEGLRTNAATASTEIKLGGTLSTADTLKTVSAANVMDGAGGSHTLTLEFANNTAVTAGSWLVTVKDGATTVGSGEVRFASGLLNPAFNTVNVSYSPAGVAALTLKLTLASDTTSAATGASTLAVSSVDGFGKGDLTTATFNSSGNLVLSYSNGQTSQAQTLALARFGSTADLSPHGSNAYTTSKPNAVTYGVAKSGVSSITAESLEASNVDLSTQFSAIIVTQRGYQAASQIISTANEMLDTLLRMKG